MTIPLSFRCLLGSHRERGFCSFGKRHRCKFGVEGIQMAFNLGGLNETLVEVTVHGEGDRSQA